MKSSSAVGPLDVLEDHDDRARRRPAARRTAARRRTDPRWSPAPSARRARAGARAAARRKRRSSGVGDVLLDDRRELRERRAGPRPRRSAPASGPSPRAPSRRRPRRRRGSGRGATSTSSDEPVEVLLELPGEARLADPGDPDDRDQVRLALLGAGVEELLDQAQLAVAADERRLEADRLLRAAAAATTRERAPERARLGLPLQLVRAGVLVGDRRLGRPPRRLADEHRAGSAADWMRDAVFTRSPATMPWPSAPSVTAASPVSTPARARRSGAPKSAPSA